MYYLWPRLPCSQPVTRFGKTSNNAIEHVFMYKLIKINIPINMYTEVIFTTPISLQWKEAWLWYYWILWSKPFHLIPKNLNINFSVITEPTWQVAPLIKINHASWYMQYLFFWFPNDDQNTTQHHTARTMIEPILQCVQQSPPPIYVKLLHNTCTGNQFPAGLSAVELPLWLGTCTLCI